MVIACTERRGRMGASGEIQWRSDITTGGDWIQIQGTIKIHYKLPEFPRRIFQYGLKIQIEWLLKDFPRIDGKWWSGEGITELLPLPGKSWPEWVSRWESTGLILLSGLISRIQSLAFLLRETSFLFHRSTLLHLWPLSSITIYQRWNETCSSKPDIHGSMHRVSLFPLLPSMEHIRVQTEILRELFGSRWRI